MKKILQISSIVACIALIVIAFSFRAVPEHTSYEYKQFSTIESVIPGGLGRSRIVTTDDAGQVVEKELKNFYSLVGINFGNIANNDRAIVDRINQYDNEGWELMSISTGVHGQTSDGSSSGGVFITRYLFRRAK